MTSKRKGKEIEGSGSGAGTKREVVGNHGVEFKNAEQRNRYKALISKLLHACRYPDSHTMNVLEIRHNVVRLLNKLGWVDMLRPMMGFENFTYEFLSSIAFK